VNSVDGYCGMLGRGTLPIVGKETLTEEQERMESLYLGFRIREGVDLSLVLRQEGAERILSRLEEEKLVKVAGGRVLPTLEGFAVADGLPALFL
ncbi:MAG: coproporphyrinogen III oxidase family protein, partial [Deltaproteobacteria bacterium]|nr:coproporphyrinogen III oxidase family protein [Deltaproteobacteria bacterium]